MTTGLAFAVAASIAVIAGLVLRLRRLSRELDAVRRYADTVKLAENAATPRPQSLKG